MSYTKKMTEGSELKHIILFTLPLFAGNVFQQLYNIVDSIIVGKYLGANKLAAVGTTGSPAGVFRRHHIHHHHKKQRRITSNGKEQYGSGHPEGPAV